MRNVFPPRPQRPTIRCAILTSPLVVRLRIAVMALALAIALTPAPLCRATATAAPDNSVVQDMTAHLARHNALQERFDAAREDLEAHKAVAADKAGEINYFLFELELLAQLAQNAFDLSFLYYDHFLERGLEDEKLMAGYVGQRLKLLSKELDAVGARFQQRVELSEAARAVGVPEVLPPLFAYTQAVRDHGEAILTRAQP